MFSQGIEAIKPTMERKIIGLNEYLEITQTGKKGATEIL